MPTDPVRPPSALTKYTTPDLWTVDGDVVPLDSPRTEVYLASAVDAKLEQIANGVAANAEIIARIEPAAEQVVRDNQYLRSEVARLSRALEDEKARNASRVDVE